MTLITLLQLEKLKLKRFVVLPSRPNTDLPDVLIIGVRKAGTSALRHFLSLHPDLVLDSQEKHFFDHEYNYVRGLQWYASQLPKKRHAGQLLVEKNTSLLFLQGRSQQNRGRPPQSEAGSRREGARLASRVRIQTVRLYEGKCEGVRGSFDLVNY